MIRLAFGRVLLGLFVLSVWACMLASLDPVPERPQTPAYTGSDSVPDADGCFKEWSPDAMDWVPFCPDKKPKPPEHP